MPKTVTKVSKSESVARIVDALLGGPKSSQELQTALALTKSQVRNAVLALRSMGTVIATGNTRNMVYSLAQ